VLLAVVILSGCGSSHATVRPLALVSGQPITRQEFQQYLTYSLHFFSWLYGPDAVQPFGCTSRQAQSTCARLREQVLARLIEERVVFAYAQRHHIRLRLQDRLAIDQELANVRQSGQVAKLSTSSSFMRAMLDRELLVRRVEDAVAPADAKAGPSVHIRKISLPVGVSGRARVYRQAVNLATEGRGVPAGAQSREEWEALFRLGSTLRRGLAAARPGQFVGPFHRPGGYLVIQLLGRGEHSYGQPARQRLEGAYFRTWLRIQLERAAPHCFAPSGSTIDCPSGIINSA
jgi:hypothetical protein